MMPRDEESRSTGKSPEELAARVTDISERIQAGVEEANRHMRSELKKINFDETTIPDAFHNVPKLVSPQVHKWLDIAVSSYFGVLGTIFAIRGKSGAATAAFINAGMVAGVSAFTDYEGNGRKPINFKLHGTLDAVQAATAALGPVLHGFADEAESAFFYGQAANEAAVIATTDWDAGMPARRRRKAA